MAAALAWAALVLMGYLFIALFFIEHGSKRLVRAATERGEITSNPPKTYWGRLVWVKKHRTQLPADARSLANRVVAFDLSARISGVVLLILYGIHGVAL
jgi:hypothetical protein